MRAAGERQGSWLGGRYGLASWSWIPAPFQAGLAGVVLRLGLGLDIVANTLDHGFLLVVPYIVIRLLVVAALVPTF